MSSKSRFFKALQTVSSPPSPSSSSSSSPLLLLLLLVPKSLSLVVMTSSPLAKSGTITMHCILNASSSAITRIPRPRHPLPFLSRSCLSLLLSLVVGLVVVELSSMWELSVGFKTSGRRTTTVGFLSHVRSTSLPPTM